MRLALMAIILIGLGGYSFSTQGSDEIKMISESWYASMISGVPPVLFQNPEVISKLKKASVCIGEKAGEDIGVKQGSLEVFHHIATIGSKPVGEVKYDEQDAIKINEAIRQAEKLCGVHSK